MDDVGEGFENEELLLRGCVLLFSQHFSKTEKKTSYR